MLLSLLSIVNAVLIVVPFLSGAGREVVIVMETLLTPVFLVDFLVRLARSRPRATYLVREFGWADLLAIVPLLRVFRLFRVVIVVRQLQARGPAQIAEDLSVTRAAATFFTTIFLVIVVLEVSGMLILDAENGIEGANIEDAERRAVVGLRDHHDRGLRRPVPRDAPGPDHRHLPPDRGRGPLQRVHGLHRERLPHTPTPPPAPPAPRPAWRTAGRAGRDPPPHGRAGRPLARAAGQARRPGAGARGAPRRRRRAGAVAGASEDADTSEDRTRAR